MLNYDDAGLFRQPDGLRKMKQFIFTFWLIIFSFSVYADSANCGQKNSTPESIAATMDQALKLKHFLNSQPS